jgi:hypothetical protein
VFILKQLTSFCARKLNTVIVRTLTRYIYAVFVKYFQVFARNFRVGAMSETDLFASADTV